MRTALLSDIHGNLEALRACLAHARAQGASAYAFLGDLVGYHADPIGCLDLVREHAARGAVVVRGNHDAAALGGLWEDMGFVAREAIYWTRDRLGPEELSFLGGLPLIVRQSRSVYVHASADRPGSWTYITSERQAEGCLAAADSPLVFAGHVHHQALYYGGRTAVHAHQPAIGSAIPVPARWQWLAIVGSVGQPRDGNPAAAYAIHDADRSELCFHRVPYDCARAARKVRDAGLPERLALRLLSGN